MTILTYNKNKNTLYYIMSIVIFHKYLTVYMLY